MTDRPKFQARPTVYKGVKMRSRLEAGYAQWLDSWGFTWEYEPQCFAGEAGQYLPDFVIRDVSMPAILGIAGADRRADVYVEIKPDSWSGDLLALAKRMSIIWESFPDPDPELLLEVPGRPPLSVHQYGEDKDGNPVWQERVWTYNVSSDFTEYLHLAYGLQRGSQPWPHGYWKGPG